MPKITSIAGFYYDPRHGGCLRAVALTSRRGDTAHDLVIRGVYGTNELEPLGTPWRGVMDVVSKTGSPDLHMLVRFVGKRKPEPEDLVMKARYISKTGCIHWSDGNMWRPMVAHPSQFQRLNRFAISNIFAWPGSACRPKRCLL